MDARVAAGARLAAEFAQLALHSPPGVFVRARDARGGAAGAAAPDGDGAAGRDGAGGWPVWDGVAFVRSGPLAGGAFAFALAFVDYPASAPELCFVSDLFHPEVEETSGRVDPLPAGCKWDGSRHSALDVLKRVKAVVECSLEGARGSVRNADADSLAHDDPEAFEVRAAACVRGSLASGALHAAGGLPFAAWDDDVHGAARDAILKRQLLPSAAEPAADAATDESIAG